MYHKPYVLLRIVIPFLGMGEKWELHRTYIGLERELHGSWIILFFVASINVSLVIINVNSSNLGYTDQNVNYL